MALPPVAPKETSLLVALAAVVTVFVVVELLRTAVLATTHHDDPALSVAVQGTLTACVVAVAALLAKIVGRNDGP